MVTIAQKRDGSGFGYLAPSAMEKGLMERFRINRAGRRVRVLPKTFQRRPANFRMVFTVIDHPFGYAQGRLSVVSLKVLTGNW